jgi:hypothetical protein
MRTWAIFDVSDFPPSIEVEELLISSYVYPSENELDTIYRRLNLDPRDYEARTCMDALDDLVYSAEVIPSGPGEVVTTLGDSANADFEEAVRGSGHFMIGITGSHEIVFWGHHDVGIDGWSLGRPRLTVVYEDPTTPVEPTTWGHIKARHGMSFHTNVSPPTSALR